MTRLVNPEAHALLTDQGAATFVMQCPADFDDGDPENGPGSWGHPDTDVYYADERDLTIEWRGLGIWDITPDEPECFDEPEDQDQGDFECERFA